MTIRRINVDRMRRYSARSTPDFLVLEISTKELDSIGETGVQRLFKSWMDKMRIKHLGKRKRIDFFQEYLVDRNVYYVGARVVNNPYARPIKPTRSRL